jgi:hypothetical protein
VNQNQPSVNWSTANQRMDDRRNAAADYRLARSARRLPRARPFTVWSARLKRRVAVFRDSLGHGLIALGERVSADRPDPIGEM